MKKKIGVIITLITLMYILSPFQVSNDKVIFVDKGTIWSGNIETNEFKTILSRSFITNVFYISADIVNREKIYRFNNDEYIFSLAYDKNNKRLYAITENKYSNDYSLKEIYDGKETTIKKLGNSRRYFQLYYCNDRLYYWADDRNKNRIFLEIFDLNKREIKTRIPVVKIGANINCFDDILVYSSVQGNKKNIYAVKDDSVISLFLENMIAPIKNSDTEMICLDGTNLNNIYLYDLESGQRKLIGKNDGRAWCRHAFILSNRQYYITKKNIHGYDIQEWYTINDLNGGMQILFVDGPIISSI